MKKTLLAVILSFGLFMFYGAQFCYASDSMGSSGYTDEELEEELEEEYASEELGC